MIELEIKEENCKAHMVKKALYQVHGQHSYQCVWCIERRYKKMIDAEEAIDRSHAIFILASDPNSPLPTPIP